MWDEMSGTSFGRSGFEGAGFAALECAGYECADLEAVVLDAVAESLGLPGGTVPLDVTLADLGAAPVDVLDILLRIDRRTAVMIRIADLGAAAGLPARRWRSHGAWLPTLTVRFLANTLIYRLSPPLRDCC